MARNSRAAGSTALAVLLCAASLCGCAGLTSGIDPTGRRVFVDTPDYHDAPGPKSLWSGMEMLLYPQETVAPVGTEVVLLAGVRGRDQYLITNQKVEWNISQGSVGHFVDLGWGSPFDLLVFDFTGPRLIDATRAIGTTSRKYIRLTRGNANPNDDVEVLRGQTWISLTSPQDGTTYVTAFSPDVYSWDLHKQTATIHWVDAQWQFPPPAINPAGSTHGFTTTVMKQSNSAPCVDWRVRYEIIGGPPAGFVPDGTQAVEVPTNNAGQATAEIFQEQPVAGTNQIAIQVIRPGGVAGGNGKRLVVGSGCTSKTWSAPGLSLRVSGPDVAAVGSTATYRVDVSNPGDLPAQDVVVSNPVPAGFRYLDSNPSGEELAGTIQWRLGSLSPGETRSLDINLRAEIAGTMENCVEATSSGGLSTRQCVTTVVGRPDVLVNVTGPEEARVGEDVTFQITITNQSQIAATGLLIKDRFDPGLEHAELPSPIERDLGAPLAPGQSRSIGVVLRVTRPGVQCQSVDVILDGQVLASARACVTGVPSAQPQPPAAAQPEPPDVLPGLEPPPPSPPQPSPEPQPPQAQPSISLQVTAPDASTVGETVELNVTVLNPGRQAVSNLRVVIDYEEALDATLASPGFAFDGDDIFWVIETLDAGGKEEFRLQARCVAPTPRACSIVRVVGDRGVLDEKEVCVEVRAAPRVGPADLSMVVADRLDPVSLGKSLTYVIQLQNNGQNADRKVSVVVTLPPQFTLVPLETTGPAAAPGFTRDGPTIRFQPVEEIGPGASLTYRVRVQAAQPGEVRLRAQLTSENLAQPIVVEEDTLVFEE